MKRETLRANFALSILAVAVAATGAFGQDRELTVEELFLRDIEFQVLKEQAFSDDREGKIDVLEQLREMVDGGEVGTDDLQIQFVLEYLSLEGTAIRILEGRSVVNNFPEVRRQATQLLGEVGSVNSTPTLIAILLRDEESMVRAEAAFALGEIGTDDYSVLDALVVAMERLDPVAPDNTFSFAAIFGLPRPIAVFPTPMPFGRWCSWPRATTSARCATRRYRSLRTCATNSGWPAIY